jgi:hypothetical protein
MILKTKGIEITMGIYNISIYLVAAHCAFADMPLPIKQKR